jgi:hypothetical protein
LETENNKPNVVPIAKAKANPARAACAVISVALNKSSIRWMLMVMISQGLGSRIRGIFHIQSAACHTAKSNNKNSIG